MAKAETKTEKPLLFGEDYSANRFDPKKRFSDDPYRIEGYSETVRANDIARADDLAFREAHRTSKGPKTKEDMYREFGTGPKKLPVEFSWLRISGPGGANSPTANAEIDAYTVDQGYLPCTKERFDALAEAYGYRFNHASWRVAEDGTIRMGYDLALFFRRSDVAEMWRKHLADETAARENASLPAELSASDALAETFREEEIDELIITH